MSTRSIASRVVALALMIGGLAAGGAAAQSSTPSLVVALYAKPANRAALRATLARDQAARLHAWKLQGVLSGYRLLFSRYPDAGTWDGMEVLTFRDGAALARWKAIEQHQPGGLSASALRLVEQIVATPADRVRSAGPPREVSDPAFLILPYQALVSTPAYLEYLDGYTLPQFDGWIAEGALDGYEIELSRYPADRPWLAMILLRYRDDAALEHRDETTAKVRARLAENPAWKATSDNKKAVRVEKVAAVADQLAAEEGAR